MAFSSRRGVALYASTYLGFVSIGLPVGLLGVTWPSVQETLGVPVSHLGILLFAFGIGNVVGSLSSAPSMKRRGLGSVVLLGGVVSTSGVLGYALAPGWLVFVGAGLVSGFGGGMLAASLNAFAAMDFSGRHMNWLHALYGIGAMIGPPVMMGVFHVGLSWRWVYGLVGLWLLAITVLFVYVRPAFSARIREEAGRASGPDAGADETVTPLGVLRHGLVWLQILLFFVYTGLEVTTAQWSYTLFTEARAMPVGLAASLVSVFWGTIAGGRILFGFVVDRLGTERLMYGATGMAVLATALIWVSLPPVASLVVVGLAGLALAPIFPCLTSETPQRFGARRAPVVVGFQVGAAMAGSMLFPALAGLLTDYFSLELIAPYLLALAVVMTVLHGVVAGRTLPDPAAELGETTTVQGT